MSRKNLNAAGFRLPPKKPREDLAPEDIEAFARGEEPDSKPASSRASKAASSKSREGGSSQARKTVSSRKNKPASSKSREGGSSQARKTVSSRKSKPASSQAETASSARPRSGTGSLPYMRQDGTATRSTTVHLEVELHRRLRMQALEENRSMSEVVASAVRNYLD